MLYITFFITSKLQRITRPGMAIPLKLANSSIICVWTKKNDPKLFDIRPTGIPLYKTFVMLFNICPNVVQYLLRYSLWPRTIIFVICLLFNLGYRGLWLASRTNLKLEPRIAEVWYQTYFPISNFYPAKEKMTSYFWKKFEDIAQVKMKNFGMNELKTFLSL